MSTPIGTNRCATATSNSNPSPVPSAKQQDAEMGQKRAWSSCGKRRRDSALNSWPPKDNIPLKDCIFRLAIKLPAGGRMALWVCPDAYVGPKPHREPARFTDIWGEDAEFDGPCGRAPFSSLAPVA